MTATAGSSSSDLARTVASEFSAYFRHLATRVEVAARSVTAEQLWAQPFPFGNSIGHLILHLTGNLNHYVGSLLGGSDYVRDRQHEFTDREHHSLEQLLERFGAAVDTVAKTLADHDADAFCQSVADQPPIKTRLGLFLVCAAHMNNHIGQMSYLIQAFETTTKEPPVW